MKRELLLTLFVIMLTTLISIIATLINPDNWSSIGEMLSDLPVWGIILIILASLAYIALVWWAIRFISTELRKIDEAKDKKGIEKMKEAFKEVLRETGLAKEAKYARSTGKKKDTR